MSFLKNMTKTNMEKNEDRVGGGFERYPTDIYVGKITHAFLGQWDSGAKYFDLAIVMDDGKKYQQKITITNSKGDNFWTKEGKNYPLPGFTILDDLAQTTAGVDASELDTEERIIMVKDNGQDVQKSVEMIVQLVGERTAFALQRKITTKMEKDAEGKYTIPTTTENSENEIVKIFHEPTMMTTVEAANGKEAGEFHKAWLEANQGKDRDARYKGNIKPVAAGAPTTKASAPGVAPKPGAAAPAKKSLFNK